MRIWIYYFRHALNNFLSHRLVNVICLGTMSASLLLFGLFMLLFVNLDNWLQQWGKTSLSMSVYLDDPIEEEVKNNIIESVKRIPGAEITGFVSKDQAMQDFKRTLGNQAGLLDGLKENPLPASIEVVFNGAERGGFDPRKWAARLEAVEGVSEVQYSDKWQERFEGFLNIVRTGGFIIVGFLCLAVLFIITNTIKLTIYSRREEIEIFKIVGATDWFVKTPFLIEGAIHGAVSGVAAVVALYGIYGFFFSIDQVRLFGLPMMEIIFLPLTHIVSILSLSMVLGLLGGVVAVGRFFKF